VAVSTPSGVRPLGLAMASEAAAEAGQEEFLG
jgi:hypothetical protein